jgi:serine/threonine protein kinase
MLQPNALLQNRYRVVQQIGEGGMGAVYVATDERFGSTVALKETFFRDPIMLKAFEREARLLNRLRHPALPRVSDHFTEGEGQFLVMEFIAGEDLSAMLARRGSAFPVQDVLRWADELLDALDYLHTQEPSIIHRDIKPQNLKLTPRGQTILLDFGLAKGTPWQASHVTASVFGYSRNYAPIEQIQGTGTDTRSDIYSLGATVYHLMTGQPPPDALTRAMAVLNEHADPLKLASETNPQVPHAVAQVIARSMAQTSANRPQTAAAMREELRRAASDAGTSDAVALAPNAQTTPTPNVVTPTPNAMPPNAATRATSEQETQLFDANAAQPTVRDAAAQPTQSAARAASLSNARGASATAGKTSVDEEATRIARAQVASSAPVVVRAKAWRRSSMLYVATGALAIAVCAASAAFIYNFVRQQRVAGETSAQQTSQPAPDQTNANAQSPSSSSNTNAPNATQTEAQPASQPSLQPPTSHQSAPRRNAGAQEESAAQTNNAPRASENQRASQSSAKTNNNPAPNVAAPAPTPVPSDDELFAPNAPTPRGVRLPPGVDFSNMTPQQRKKYIRFMRRQIMQEQQQRIYSQQQQQQRDPDQQQQPRRRRRQPPPYTPPPQ